MQRAFLAGRSLEMLAGHLEIMLRCDRLRIADPGAGDMHRELLSELRLAGRAEVLKSLWPRFQTGSPNDPMQLSSQILVSAAILGHDEFRPRFGKFKSVFKERPQLGKERNEPAFSPGQMLRLWALNVDPAVLPVDVLPPQSQMLRRAPQTTVAAQREDQTPLGIRAGFDDSGGFLAAHKVEPVRIPLNVALEVLKGHTGYVTSVAFNPDGQRLASASVEVKVWDARPWTPELMAQSQARGLLTMKRDRAKSLKELQATIRDDKTISDLVRKQALDWAELFWKNRQPVTE